MSLAAVLSPLAPSLCFGCGGACGRGGPLCPDCRRTLVWLGPDPVVLGRPGRPALRVWSPLAYTGGAAALVRALKFRGAVALAQTMAAQIGAGAPRTLLAGQLVPVPLSAARRRRRGFNQAELLARALGARTGMPVADLLERAAGGRTSQVGRGRAERLDALEEAVRVRRVPAPGRAVLVDDVVTTGATLRACAAALRRAGTDDVVAVTYARTGGR